MSTGSRRTALFLSLTFAASLTGCLGDTTPSLHPLFLPSEAVAVPTLEGNWLSDDLHLHVKADGEDVQLRVHDDNSLILKLRGRFGRLANQLFLDVVATEGQAIGSWPAHVFARVRLTNSRFEVAFLDRKWLEAGLESGRLSAAHEITDSDVILTASTSELQRLVAVWAAEDAAFEEPIVFTRDLGSPRSSRH